MLRRALAFALLVAALAAPAAAQKHIVVERFDALIAIEPDGAIEVTEQIRLRFTGSWNGIIRSIPVEYRTPRGLNYSLLVEVAGVTDPAGTPLRYESSRAGHLRELKIWIPGARDATRGIEIRYRVRNALRFFEEHDELYWNVTGDEWEMPIEAASARIRLPRGASGVRTQAYTGPYGARGEDAAIELEGDTAVFRTLRPLRNREGLTVVVGWDKGAVRPPSLVARAGLFLRSNWPLLVPLCVFAGMFFHWRAVGRDPRRQPIAAMYTPPAGMTPAELGTLIDNSADMRDITATLVDLAVRGYILIEEKQTSQMLGLRTSTDYVFHLRRPASEWNDLKAHERLLLSALSSYGNPVELSALEDRFYTHLPGLRDSIFDQLVARHYYARRPDMVKQIYVGAGLGAGVVLAFGAAALVERLGISELTAIGSAVLTGAIIAGFGLIMPARTAEGARALEGALGFAEFLNRVESDRLNRMVKTPEMFEKFLPYAMALGVERKWAAAFDDIAKRPPEWYRGPTPVSSFRARALAGDLGRMTARASSAMRSAPRSSGGSGFSRGGGGGGFSGGGFGGGGGRGF